MLLLVVIVIVILLLSFRKLIISWLKRKTEDETSPLQVPVVQVQKNPMLAVIAVIAALACVAMFVPLPEPCNCTFGWRPTISIDLTQKMDYGWRAKSDWSKPRLCSACHGTGIKNEAPRTIWSRVNR